MKKSVISAALLATATLTSAAVSAQELSVKITNLTNGTYFTPVLVAAHSSSVDLFELGMPATMHLRMMAEGGNLAGLVSDVANAGANYVANPASGLLAPGASTTAMLAPTVSPFLKSPAPTPTTSTPMTPVPRSTMRSSPAAAHLAFPAFLARPVVMAARVQPGW